MKHGAWHIIVRSLVVVWLLGWTCVLTAATRMDFVDMKHELRVGWGDQLFETAVWHNPTSIIVMPDNSYIDYSNQMYHYKENYTYYQHLWMEYQYNVSYWFALGLMADGSGFSWNNVVRNGYGIEQQSDPQHAYNIVAMPTMRFTYFFHPNLNIYSSLGVGVDVNGGTETNAQGHRIEVGGAFNITLLGVSASYKHFFMALEYGGMYGLHSTNEVYMLKSRMFTASLGVRF